MCTCVSLLATSLGCDHLLPQVDREERTQTQSGSDDDVSDDDSSESKTSDEDRSSDD